MVQSCHYKIFAKSCAGYSTVITTRSAKGAPEKHLRAAFSRRSLDEVIAFRTHVDEAMENCLDFCFDNEAPRHKV